SAAPSPRPRRARTRRLPPSAIASGRSCSRVSRGHREPVADPRGLIAGHENWPRRRVDGLSVGYLARLADDRHATVSVTRHSLRPELELIPGQSEIRQLAAIRTPHWIR